MTEATESYSALDESRSCLAGLVDSAMDAIITIDEAQNVVLFNPAAERMFRCSSADAVGHSVDRFIPARFRDAHREQVRGFGLTGVTRRRIGALGTISGVRTDGEEFPIEASISQLATSKGTYYTVILRDVTELRRAERALARASEELELRVKERTAELEAANRELESFSYSVSHDLRGPLRAIDGFSSIVLRDHAAALPADGRRYLGLVREGAQQMARLIDDMLTFAKSARQPIARRTVVLKALVHECLEEFRGEIAERKTEVEVGNLPDCQADPALLKQALVNLLGNALKYTRKQPHAKIEVGCRPDNGEEAYYVKDNGVGFDMKHADKLFGVFQRLHHDDDFEGTGVGLAIVQRVVHRHGGRVWAEAQPGKGATFYFTLGKDQA
jgi:PAS domain S-box-containing protein